MARQSGQHPTSVPEDIEQNDANLETAEQYGADDNLFANEKQIHCCTSPMWMGGAKDVPCSKQPSCLLAAHGCTPTG